MAHEPIRVLYAREHGTIFPGQGVFLAGPTPPDGQMEGTWRRVLIERLAADQRLDPSMTVVAPEPRNGRWDEINTRTGKKLYDQAVNAQIAWEWQYLGLCDVTVFWLATYWDEQRAAPFPGNIGPTTRWEFGFYFQEYVRDPARRTFIVGGPDDAESVHWPKRLCATHGVRWHTLPVAEKQRLVPDSLVEAVAEALVSRR
jgi:hypothetical protein